MSLKRFPIGNQRKIVDDMDRFVIESFSAKHDGMYYVFMTKAGECRYLHSYGKEFLSLFFRFDNVALAKDSLADVGATGKWNHHLTVSDNTEPQINYVKWCLKRLSLEQA